MKVLFLTVGPDIVASSRARVYQYLTYLHKESIQTKVIPFTPKAQAYKIINNVKRNQLDKISGKIYSCISILKFLFLCRKYDILFIQKIILPVGLVNIIKKLNSNMVFDFDDAIFLTDECQHNPNGKSLRRFNYILKNCNCVIVGNSFLKERAIILNKKVHTLITPIDTNRFFPKRGNNGIKNNIVLGWIGSPDSHRYLKDLKYVFEILAEKYNNLKFEFIGAGDFYKEMVKFNIKKWNFDREAQDLQNLDIGIMPLKDDEWCMGKGGYKLLQYMAVGIPCVASPVGINKEIIKDGKNGFLANTHNEWLDKLSLLIEDVLLRHKIGEEGRRLAEASYSYMVSAPRLIEIFKNINSGDF